MDRYKQRTIAELLKKTSKLNRPRMTSILEGKDRMQGPLDKTDAEMDFRALQVCGNCRNHLDTNMSQDCGICNRGYHSFCLEVPLNAATDSFQCCYDCQHQAAFDDFQPGSRLSINEAHDKQPEEGMDICKSSENVQGFEEPGTSYTANEQSPALKGTDMNWKEASPSKSSVDPEDMFSDTLYKPAKTRAARKLGIRRKKIADDSGHDSSSGHVMLSDPDTSKSTCEGSGMDVVQTSAVNKVLLEVGGVVSTCHETALDEMKDHDCAGPLDADIQLRDLGKTDVFQETKDDQMLEASLVVQDKHTENLLEETVTEDKPMKDGQMSSVASVVLAVADSVKAGMVSEDHPTEGCNVCTVSERHSHEVMQDETRVIGSLVLRDSDEELHPPNQIGGAVTSMVVSTQVSKEDQTGFLGQHNVVGEGQSCIQRSGSSAGQLSKQDDEAHPVLAEVMWSMVLNADMPLHDTTDEAVLLPTAHRTVVMDENAKSKWLSSGLAEQAQDDKVKPSIFVDEKWVSPPIAVESDETLQGYLGGSAVVNKGGQKEEIPLKENVSPSAGVEMCRSFIAPEPICVVPLGSPNAKSAIEDDMKVCDICGDAGYEDMLAVCSECNGAEHVYCFQTLMGQVPEGYWQCEVCRPKQRGGDSRPPTDTRPANPLTLRSPSFNSTRKQSSVGNARSRLSALLQKRRLPPEKKRALKGVPSSQFPAKRGALEDLADAPATKKQAVEVTIPVYMPSPRLGLSKEGSFKISDTGKAKFVSHTTFMGMGGEGMGLSSRGSGKLSLPAGSFSSLSLNSNTIQTGQTSKGRFLTASNSFVGLPGSGNAKVNMTTQTNNSCPSVLLATPGLKASGSLKSSDSLPSFLLPSKSFGCKLQASAKASKEAMEVVGMQGLAKEGLSGQTGMPNTRTLNKVNSFKPSKATGSSGPAEQNSRADTNLDSVRSSGSKSMHSELGLVKAVESKCEVASAGSMAENKSKASAAIELNAPLEAYNGVNNSTKLIKHELSSSLQVRNPSARNEAVVVGSGRSEPLFSQQSSDLSSSMKDFQDFSMEDDKKMALQATSPNTLARQKTKAIDKAGPDTLKEVSKASADDIQSIIPAPYPASAAKEPGSFKAEGSKILQPGASMDGVGEKYASALVDKAPTHDESRSIFTPRSRSFGAWGCSPSFTPSLGSTRCYRCKELGHSAKNCNNRSSMPCISSDTAGALKGVVPASSIDNTARNTQSVVEVAAKTKPTTEMAPIVKPPGIDRGLASKISPTPVQKLSLIVGEVQQQVQEGQALGNAVPSSTPSSDAMVDLVIRTEEEPPKQNIAQQITPMLSPTQVSLGAGYRDDATESVSIKKEDDTGSVRPVNPTCLGVPIGAQTATSPTECQPTVFSVPSATKSAAFLSAALGTLSGVGTKGTSPFVSRYQESLKVCPEAEIVWQGTFEMSRVSFHGLQANASNRASPKVREVAKKLQPSLPLEELPRGSEHNSWPVQFQKSPPINDNIALYFFASSKESYVQYYKPLVDRLIKLDLALKGFIEDAELLIFPSNLLPPGSQCWNNFMFLWAVFRDRKPPIKQPITHPAAGASKQSESCVGPKLPLQPGVFTWGRGEDVQIDTIGNKSIVSLDTAGKKTEMPSSTATQGANVVGPCIQPDTEFTLCEQISCQQALQNSMQAGEAVVKESFEQKADKDVVSSLPGKAVTAVTPSILDDMSAPKFQLLNPILPAREGCPGLDAPRGFIQKPISVTKLGEEGENQTEVVAPSIAKLSSVLLLPRIEHCNMEKSKRSTPLMPTSPALMVCPSPRERQEDAMTPRKLARPSSHSPTGYQDKDKEKGVRERIFEKSRESERMEAGRGLSRDRDRDRQRDREKQREKDRDRERPRRHTEWERERERERGKERERDRDRDRDRARERERDRERWRDRDERDRRGRDWDRDREKVGEREKGRERTREREPERERTLGRDRSSRHRNWDLADTEHGRGGRHWHRYPRSRSPSRSPQGNRDWSPSRSRLERYHNRYHRSFRHSRSYSRSPDSDHGLGRLQPRAESRELSKDSFAQKGKSPDIVVGDSRAREEAAIKNITTKDSGGEDQGNFSQRGSNSDSLCRENTLGLNERKVPIADLNLSPSELEGNEDEGNEDDATMSREVTMPPAANQDDTSHYCDFFLAGLPGGSNGEPGECSNSAGKILNHRDSFDLMSVDERNDCLSHSLVNESTDPSLYPFSMSSEPSSSCLQFFPLAADDGVRAHNTPDLNLALGAKEESPPRQGELPLFMQLLDPCQESSKLAAHIPFSDVSLMKVSEQADLSLSLAIPEHSKRPVVNTSLRLFG